MDEDLVSIPLPVEFFRMGCGGHLLADIYVHFMHAVLMNLPKKDKAEIAYELRDAHEDERSEAEKSSG
jgi:hypothetical protein